jgi:thymidylate synthase (FAD)
MQVRLVSKSVIEADYVSYLLNELQAEPEFQAIVSQPEGLMAYIARVSSPNPTNQSYAKLLKYCIDHKHWSVFESVNLVFELETSRAISAQILRHRSFCFQEFSQRYQAVDDSGVEIYAARKQDTKNRQNSTDDLPNEIKQEWETRQLQNWKECFGHYIWALDNNIAKECARMVLPLSTKTKIFMTGNVRNWIHYIELRTANGTQQEHKEIALAIKQIFVQQMPEISTALEWN